MEEAHHVWILVHFYGRLWLAIRHNRISTLLVPELFGELFYWWYIIAFESNTNDPDWIGGRHLRELAKWFDQNVDLVDLDRWKDVARRDRDERRQSKVVLLPAPAFAHGQVTGNTDATMTSLKLPDNE